MLTKFDDYPIQQTAEPIAYLATSDRDAYGRYWFNGFDPDGEFYFSIAFGVYPHREVMDCALSIVRRDGTQDNFRASRRLQGDRTDTRVGPLTLHIDEPMRRLRITIDKNSTGITADLTFHANSPAHVEPLDLLRMGVRVVMQNTRYSQFGMWGGHITVGERRQEINPERVCGVRDRSWGCRSVGEPEGGATRRVPEQLFWLWAPIIWKDRSTHYGLFEDAQGRRSKEFGQIFPRYPIESGFDTLSEAGFKQIIAGDHRLTFQKGSRMIGPSEIDLIEDGKTTTIKLEPLLLFHMMGIGYGHPTWGHGCYKGEEAIVSEHWNLKDIDINAPQYQHCQQVVRATSGDQVGYGVVEQYISGPHHRYWPVTGSTNPAGES